MQGKVKIFANNGFQFTSCKDGETFGEFEVIFNEHRIGKAVAQTDCLLYTLSK